MIFMGEILRQTSRSTTSEECEMKIIDFAIDVEQAEQDLYRRLALCSRDLAIRSIFNMIASKESVLLRKLRQLKADPVKNSLEIHREPQLQVQLQRNHAGSCELLDENDIRNDLSSYSYILRTEQLVFNLYAKLKDRESDPDAQALLNLILKEKQQEIDRIHTLYDVAKVIH
jgi:rubrerythrin